jgi:hypothetical protein
MTSARDGQRSTRDLVDCILVTCIPHQSIPIDDGDKRRPVFSNGAIYKPRRKRVALTIVNGLQEVHDFQAVSPMVTGERVFS